MAVDYITDREVLASIPKAEDVDIRVSVVQIAGARVLEIQDITRSNKHVSRGWYCMLNEPGLAAIREISAVMAALVMEEEM
jgi:hypothetical protein